MNEETSKQSGPGSEDSASIEKKRELLRRLLAQDISDPTRIPIKPAEPGTGTFPLSFAQEELWVMDQIDPGSVAFNIAVPPIRLTGRLDHGALERAVNEVIRRHDVLRTTFATQGGEPVQVVAPEYTVKLDPIDLSSEPTHRRDLAVRRETEKALEHSFNLAKGPLFQMTLMRLAEERHVLLFAMHHTVFDAVSMALFIDELSRVYTAFAAGQPSPLPQLPVQYGDFAQWQRQWLKGTALAKQLAYWKDKLSGMPELKLPLDRPRPAVPSPRAVRESVRLPRELSDALKAIGRKEGATPFITVMAAFITLMHRYSQQDDVGVGSPITTRRRTELEGLLGFFVNMVVLRTDMAGKPSFREVLRRVREVSVGAMGNSDVPFDRIVRELGIQRRAGRNPLFQAALAYEVSSPGSLKFGDLGIELMRFHSDELAAQLKAEGVRETPMQSAPTRFDLEAYARDNDNELSIEFLGARDLFDASTLRQMLTSFRTLLENVVANPDAPVAALSMVNAQERQQLLVEWNQTARAYPREASVHGLFEAQARKTPNALAVEFGDEKLTYAELDRRSTRLATHLRTLGVGPDVLVGMSLPRSVNTVVAMLGILKAGGAYLPLDPDYPQERLVFMMEDARVNVVVTDTELAGRLPQGNATMVCVDRDWMSIDVAANDKPSFESDPLSLAYVIYTSGSTGLPKGAQVTHRAINRLVVNTDYVQASAHDRFAQVSVVSFDAATFEIWGALLQGATVVVVPREVSLSPLEFGDFLRSKSITTMFLTTALFNQMSRARPDAFSTLKYLLFGGEACDVNCVRAVLQAGGPKNLLHVYGPTEVTTFSTWHLVSAIPDSATTVPIGRPIANTTAYVLDEHGEPVPVGMAGELFLGGDGVARGYLNRPELTESRFVPDRFSGNAGAKLYRTGDWVKYLPDGAIEFVGRRDGQVKIRGFRIEIGEVEAALVRLAQVQEAVVMVREDEPGDKRVVAYVVPKETQGRSQVSLTPSGGDSPQRGGSGGSSTGEHKATLTADELRSLMRKELPDYMVPSAFVVMDELPLNANGKVDRPKLPIPNAQGAAAKAEVVLPSSELEQRIAAVWREMLKLDQVGIKENFFDLGGHSLLLVKTHARLVEETGCEFRVVDLFSYPTIESLAGFLQQQMKPGEGGSQLTERAKARALRRGSADGKAEPIAIIGMAGRFPGASSVEIFWANLCDGKESVVFFTKEEMRAAGVPESMLADPNFVGAKGYLEDADKFDATFFGYSAREAELIDPQQRLLLECASELIDRAGYDPERYDGFIGVYAGATMGTYLSALQAQNALPASVGKLSQTLASAQDFLTTRISYKLNLRGPSLNIQTACSTSLVAVHQACMALHSGECDMAMAGGVSITVPLKSGHVYVEEGIGSPDGHCRAFDAEARGTVAGNGAALVLLKRLSDAIADGDHIHAVIRGTGINNDGSAKVGYTAPSVEGQAEAIALAQAAADVPPDTIGYVEAHGTGTHLGDPIEISALTRVFGDGKKREAPCWISSLKTATGHLDAAAGISGLIKAALSIEHGKLAPNLHFKKPNPQIDFESGPFRVNTKLRKWAGLDGAPRRAGISSFGLGGTNAHAVLEQAPKVEPSGPAREWQVLCLSAKTPSALEKMSVNLAQHLRSNPKLPMADVAYTLQVGRREFTHRRVVACRSGEEAAALLERTGEQAPIAVARDGNRSVVFLFSGQGSQHPNMGLGLYRTEAAFRSAVDDCAKKLLPSLRFDLRDVLYPRDGDAEQAAERLKRTDVAQPALFTIEYATAQLWMSWGVKPAAMLGHSIGEFVAACIAGVMSLDDALALVAERGRLMAELPTGSMLAVSLPEAELRGKLTGSLAVAVINGPSLCVVAGPEDEIAVFELALVAQGEAPRRLHTSHAFHSPMMAPALKPFEQRVANVRLHAPQIPYVSNVTGGWITAEQATDPAYYAAHLGQAVQFSKGLETLFADADRVFLEVGPGQTLTALGRRHASRKPEHVFVPSMRHPDEQKADEAALLEGVGRLWTAGVRPDWRALHGEARRCRVTLPAYPLERTRYWIDADPKAAAADARKTGELTRVADPAQWVYVPSWKRSPIAPAAESEGARNANWIIFTDPHGLGDKLAAALKPHANRVVTVTAAPKFAAWGAGRYGLNPAVREDYDRLLTELKRDGFTPECIAHAWSVGPDSELRDNTDARAECENRGFYSVAFLVQALSMANVTTPVRLAVLASHTLDVTGEDVLCPEKAMVLAPGKVIAMEHPNVRSRAIDVRLSGNMQTLAQTLAADLRAPWHEPVVAYRGRYRWAQSFEQAPTAVVQGRPATLREGGVYLITGGLGGVGLEIAEYLARVAKARIALVGRNVLPPRGEWAALAERRGDVAAERVRRIQAIEAAGGSVLLCRADVADGVQMEAALALAQAKWGAVHGVIHAAGAEKRGEPLHLLQRAGCEAQFAPKREGLRTLETLLEGKPLDFVIVHSSLASVMGVAGFVSYTASHLFMDAFVHEHNRRGKTPWRTLNWDNWRIGEGSDAPAAANEFFMRSPELADVLGRVLSVPDAPQMLISTGSLQGRIDAWAARDDGADEASDAAKPEEAASNAHPRPDLSTPYEAPRSDAERILAGIWAEILGLQKVGIHDNFFELGGDSVLNIQITAKANQSGLKLTPRQMFEHQTIAELAPLAIAAGTGPATLAEEPPVTEGTVPLTPIQAWFLERGLKRPEYFNLPMMVEVRRPLDLELLKRALVQLEERYEGLRFRYSRANGAWAQTVVPPGSSQPVVQRFDLSGLNATEQAEKIAEHGQQLQSTLNLEHTLYKVGLFELGAGKPGRLLFALHHLPVDMISWRVLMEDLQAFYEALEQGRQAVLPAKTASFKRWSEGLTAYAQTDAAQSELEYWCDLGIQPVARLPVDFTDGPNTVASAQRLTEELTADETRALLGDVARSHGTQIDDALMLALASAVCAWSGDASVFADFEGHGREDLGNGVDVSRTVGWFTTLYPVRIELPSGSSAADRIRAVQRQRRRLPSHGIGYGVLRHLSHKPEVRDALARLPQREISFLYVGQFDQTFARDALFGPSTDWAGSPHDPEGERSHLLEVNGMVLQGRLQMTWTFSRNRHREETVRGLARSYMQALRELIGQTSAARAPSLGPAGPSAADLAEILKQMQGG